MKLNFKQFIINNNEYMREKYESEQYELSRELIKIKMDSELNEYQLAKVVGVSLHKYIQMQDGSLCVDVEDYKDVLNTLHEIMG